MTEDERQLGIYLMAVVFTFIDAKDPRFSDDATLVLGMENFREKITDLWKEVLPKSRIFPSSDLP